MNKRKRLPLFAAMLTALVTAGVVLAASVTPTVIPEASNTDKTCAVQFPGTFEVKADESPGSGQYTDGTVTVDLVRPSTVDPTNENSIDWELLTGGFVVIGVIVKDGVDGANRYDYGPGG